MPPPPPPAAAPQPVPEGAVHSDLRVPSFAPFARYRVVDLFAQPEREGLDVLDPDRPRGTYWFGANNSVSRSVLVTIKGYYDGAYPNWSKAPNHVKITWFKCFAVAPKKKGRIVGIDSVNEVARATSSYTLRRDVETAQMKARMDSQQVRLDSLKDLLDVMAVGNPVIQRMLSERRAALGMPPREPQESDPTRQQPSNPTKYFEISSTRDDLRARPSVDTKEEISIDVHIRTLIDSEAQKACLVHAQQYQNQQGNSTSIRKEARSSSIDNNACSSLDFCQPPSTQALVPSTDTRSPPSTEDTHLPSTDIFHPTSIDTSVPTSIDTEP
uniref:Uncharacterized protein n=1 Tax=Brassica oleracea var. oleracea TaxID=109376 RepID=A0A0D3D755_BRAOL